MWTAPLSPRILVKVGEKEALREAFSAANQLREAGYVAELDLGGQEPADLRWILTIQNQEPSFALLDKAKSIRVEVRNIGEVLTLLEEESADKDSLT